jgi:hypothetical protein
LFWLCSSVSRRGEKDWKNVPITWGELKNGIPWPEFFGSVQKTIGLYGYEQAHALAWAFAASAAYGMDNLDLRVKVSRQTT